MIRHFLRNSIGASPKTACSFTRHMSLPPMASFGPHALFGARAHGAKPVAADAKYVEFHFKLQDGSRKTVSVPEGTSVLEAAHMNEIGLEGACEASLACSTCHVILPDELYEATGEPTEEEEDLLDLCPGLTSTSRLGCQVNVDSKMRGLEVELPVHSLNFYVDGYVPVPH